MSSKTGCPEGTLYNLCPQMLSRLNWIKTCPAWETDTALTRQLDKRPSGVPSSLSDPILDSVQYYFSPSPSDREANRETYYTKPHSHQQGGADGECEPQ